MAESQNIEWKESWRDEYLKWICGFANAQGGKIYIGTNDDGTVIGVQDSKKLLEDIPNKVRDVLGIIVDVNLLTKDGKDYIEICVNSNSYPVNYKGEYHYRSGSTKQQLKGQALNQFLLQKTGITWDSVPIQGVTIQDLRNDSFDIFREQAVRSKRMDKKDIDATNEQLLDSLNLLESSHLKRAAILLFHHNPEKWIPGAYIKIGYFESDSELRYQDTNQATDQANQGNDNSVVTRILKVIQEEPSLSQKKIADVIGEKYSTVKYYMESMKKSGIIKREGSSQKGKWIIL